jgi:hypothetical protein
VSATRKIGIAPPPRRAIVRPDRVENVRAHRVEIAQADHAGIVPTEVAHAIAAVHREPDPARRAASRPIDLAEVLPAEIATGRERAERTLPPERWMDRSDCGSDV